MIKYLLSGALLAILVISGSVLNHGISSTSGAPAGKTGAPADAGTCQSCHSGPAATTETATITSNMPSTGYVPGTVYTITATLNATTTKGGFEATAQKPSGELAGTFILTNTTHTQLIGSGKYVTHRTAGTAVSGGTKVWTFNWQAPVAGTGDFDFFAAFNASNGNGSTSGDIILTASMPVTENTSATAIAELEAQPGKCSVYPNPATERSLVSFITSTPGTVSIEVFDMSGKLVSAPFAGELHAGTHALPVGSTESFSPGLYMVRVQGPGVNAVSRLFLN